MAVYFFYGDEDFNIELEIKKMSSKLNPDFKTMSYRILDNPDFQTLISSIRTTPMMFGNMLTIINVEKYLLTNKNVFEEKELEEIESSLKTTPDTHDIIFVLNLPKDESKKPDSRRKLYKILSQYNKKEFQRFKTYKVAEIAQWLHARAKEKGITLNDDATSLLIEQIGNNLREFDTELDKLKLIAYPDKKVTKKMVSEICISNEDLFNFTEHIMKNERDKALVEFNKLLDKKHPLEILSTTQTMLRKWIILKTKSSSSSQELSKLTGMHEFIVKQTQQKLKNTSLNELVKLKTHLFEVEYKIKNAEALDIISEVKCAIIR